MEKRAKTKILILFNLIPCWFIICGFSLLAYQGFFWFKNGYWRPFRTGLLLDRVFPNSFSWAGLNRMTSFVSNLPLAWLLLVLGLLLLLVIVKAFNMRLETEVEEAQAQSWRG